MKLFRRRGFVLKAAKVVAATPFLHLVACGGDEEPSPQGGSESGDDGGSSSTSCCAPGDGSSGSGGADGSGTTAVTTSDGSTSAPGSTSASDESSGGGSSSTGEAVCEPTPEDIEGPFYRPGIPIGGNLDVHGDPGEPLIIEGRVFDEACQPLANAVVEIWHATPVLPNGEPGDVDASYDASAEYRYYGQVATDARGAYSFTTLRPGWYLNGADYRPAHVHLKVWVGGVERLTTQLYFVGDPFNDGDPWFNPVMALDPNGNGRASLDIVV